jgi:PAS domain-containing protein
MAFQTPPSCIINYVLALLENTLEKFMETRQFADATSTTRNIDLHSNVMLDNQLFDLVPGAVYVCDLDGVVVRYNRRAGELWGRYPTPGDPKELYC